MARLSISSERPGLPRTAPARGVTGPIRYTYDSAHVAAARLPLPGRPWSRRVERAGARDAPACRWRPYAWTACAAPARRPVPAARALVPYPPDRRRCPGGHRPAAAAPGLPAAVGRSAGVAGGLPAHDRGRLVPDVPADRVHADGRAGQPGPADTPAGRVAVRRTTGGRLGPAPGHAVHPVHAGGRERGPDRQRPAQPSPGLAAFRLRGRGGGIPGPGLVGPPGLAVAAGTGGGPSRRDLRPVRRESVHVGGRPRRGRAADRERRVRPGVRAGPGLVRGSAGHGAAAARTAARPGRPAPELRVDRKSTRL